MALFDFLIQHEIKIDPSLILNNLIMNYMYSHNCVCCFIGTHYSEKQKQAVVCNLLVFLFFLPYKYLSFRMLKIYFVSVNILFHLDTHHNRSEKGCEQFHIDFCCFLQMLKHCTKRVNILTTCFVYDLLSVGKQLTKTWRHTVSHCTDSITTTLKML